MIRCIAEIFGLDLNIWMRDRKTQTRSGRKLSALLTEISAFSLQSGNGFDLTNRS